MTENIVNIHADELTYTRTGLQTSSPLKLDVGMHHKVVLQRPARSEPLRFGLGGFGFDSCFPSPSVIAGFLSMAMANALNSFIQMFRDEEAAKPWFQIYGHAQSSNKLAHNKALSERRAQVVRALLVGDAEAFIALAKGESWGTAEQQVMLRVLHCDPGVVDGEMGKLTRRAVRDFQVDYADGYFHRQGGPVPLQPQLSSDGELGPKTFTALAEAFAVACSPGVTKAQLHPTHAAVGCTEYNQISSEHPAHNRRVSLVVHEELPPHFDQAPCVDGDHDACPFDDRGLSGCLWYRLHVREPEVEQFEHHHFDLRWLPLPNGRILLSALTTLADEDDVTFEVFRTKAVEGPQDVVEASLAKSLSGALQGVVNRGVAQVVWAAPEGTNLFDFDQWHVSMDLEQLVENPEAGWDESKRLTLPVFRVRGGGVMALSHPPGQDLHRVRIETEAGERYQGAEQGFGFDVYGRAFSADLANGRTDAPRSIRDPEVPVIQYNFRGVRPAKGSSDE